MHGPCDILRDFVKGCLTDIEKTKQSISGTQAQLDALTANPDGNGTTVQLLRQRLAQLQAHLDETEAQLEAGREEFQAECAGRPVP
ncbi:hypothetical protein [Saccharothrix sp. ST-888]|uniref:hypothetical protein n=1 Tax=Saccharothrix sp. ST-888 TaxID=1427391 RepID=UPI0005EC5FB6|nr:hypothetical protein [Saccharothrix sp. ST-888]KJK55812.1 hypothetical protein UK12_26445 [Saccharothrix sp. ST-888]